MQTLCRVCIFKILYLIETMHVDVCDNQINTINALLLKNNQQSLALEIPNRVAIMSLMLHFNKRCDKLILCEKKKYMEKKEVIT